MPAYFQIQLDTTAPQGPVFELAGGAILVGTFTVPFVLTTTDDDKTGYTVKLWGDVDPAYNADIQATKATSAWIGYNTVNTLKLSGGDGAKTIYAVIRDDVGNETAELSDVVTVDVSVPVVTITVDPDLTKISKVAPWAETNFTFEVNSDISGWKVKAVDDPGATHDQGYEILDAGGSDNTFEPGTPLAANVPKVVKLTGADLQTAVGVDGPYYIKVFAQEAGSGLWST
jgi:hypothetical protein